MYFQLYRILKPILFEPFEHLDLCSKHVDVSTTVSCSWMEIYRRGSLRGKSRMVYKYIG